ncbi:cytochrome c family protein [Hyalangium versicolor]|uniref:cytochrome c family protein n=1 Tax=Hyalangium versicolor TaxID=2861190 RepID=UPI001CCE6EB7|nr:cytochrome c family protein [Hyalangium versicolor]
MSPLAWIALALAQAPLFSQGHGPVRTGKPAAELSARECQPCHERTYEEWSRSRHALAWSNSLFTQSFRDTGSSWCVHCHAPLAEQRAQALTRQGPEPALLSEGVNCATCHIRGGELLTGRAPSKDALEAHPIRQEPRLGSSEFCGGCHEFFMPEFHMPGRPDSSLPMQKTLTEWHRIARPRTGCSTSSTRSPGSKPVYRLPTLEPSSPAARSRLARWIRSTASDVSSPDEPGLRAHILRIRLHSSCRKKFWIDRSWRSHHPNFAGIRWIVRSKGLSCHFKQ